MPLKRSLAALALAAIVALTGCASDDGGSEKSESSSSESGAPKADLKGVPKVVATVNGEDISRDEFSRNYKGQLQQATMQQQQSGEGGGDIDQKKLKKDVANLLVDNHLMMQAADDEGIKATDKDIDNSLKELAEQNGMKSADDVIDALKKQGVSEKAARDDAATQYQVSTYIEKKADISEPSDDELRKQYDAMAEQGGGDEEGQDMPSFDEVRDQLAEQAVSQQRDEAAQDLIKDLRKKAKIKINL
jgi:peptidyl-prolyl cis-trans isomerase SurA